MYTHCVFIAISIFDVPPRELQTLALSLVPTAAQHAYVTDACAQAILLSCMPLLCVTCCFCSGTLRLLLNAPQLVGYCAMRDALLFAHYPTSQPAAALARNNQRTWHGNTSTTSRVLPQRHTSNSTTSRVLPQGTPTGVPPVGYCGLGASRNPTAVVVSGQRELRVGSRIFILLGDC